MIHSLRILLFAFAENFFFFYVFGRQWYLGEGKVNRMKGTREDRMEGKNFILNKRKIFVPEANSC